MSDIKIITFSVTILATVLISIGAFVEYNECHVKYDNYFKNEVSWGIIKGCTVKVENGWLPANNFRTDK